MWALETEFTSFLSVDQCVPLDICFLLTVSCSFSIIKIHACSVNAQQNSVSWWRLVITEINMKYYLKKKKKDYYFSINAKFIQKKHLKHN